MMTDGWGGGWRVIVMTIMKSNKKTKVKVITFHVIVIYGQIKNTKSKILQKKYDTYFTINTLNYLRTDLTFTLWFGVTKPNKQ